MKFSRTLFGTMFIFLSSCVAVNAQDVASIQQKLIAQYPLTKATADKTDIVNRDTVAQGEKIRLCEQQ